MLKLYTGITLLLLMFTIQIQGNCNICSSTGLACVSGTQFQVCVLNLPTGPITTCPSATVCTTEGGNICQGLGPGVVQGCQDCNKCDVTKTFACTSANTFTLCLGTTSPTEFVGTCQPDYVCNINNQFICGSPADPQNVPTCSSLTATTTTTIAPTTAPTAAPLNPTTYCRAVRKNGRFPVGIDISSTCRQYIYCFIKIGIWYGQLYNCPGSTFFDSSSSYCVNYVPARCGTVVQSLSVANIQLL